MGHHGEEGVPVRRTAPPERWHLVLEALPQHSDAGVRLRRLVKAARRVYGLRCVEVERVLPSNQPTETAERG